MNERTHDALFQDVVNTYGAALHRLCATSERHEAAQHELQQEILLNIWRGRPNFRGNSSSGTWVYRVAHNTAARHAHKAVRPPQARSIDRSSLAHPVHDQTPDKEVEVADARHVLHTAIKTLRS